MLTRKSVSWFLTDQGRKVSFGLVTGASLAFTVARFAPHTIFLEKYKDFVHYYRNSCQVELPSDLQQLYEKCLDILNVPETQRKLYSSFSVYGYDLFHAGSNKSRFGLAVGIPVNFTYKSPADLEKDDIQVNQKNINWSSEIGQKLADALILPESVKKFAICREIIMSQNYKIMFESTYPFVCIFMVYSTSQYINQKLNLYAGPLSLRLILYSIVGLFGMGSYFLMKDVTEVYYEASTDKKLCELGPEYIKSGVIFYDKILKRNQALRELMGSEGEKKYSVMGNENFFIRQPRLALVHRKQFFEEMLKKSESDVDLDVKDI